MATETIKVTTRSTASQRIIAGGIVIGFCYWAASVVVTLLVSVLLAYFLDPVVEWLERWRVPRVLGSLIVVLLTLTLLGALGYAAVDRIEQFLGDWPKYSAVLKQGVTAIERRLERVESRVQELAPEPPRARSAISIEEQRPLRSLLLRGLGSIYTLLLQITALPFLIFFMLAAKRDVWHATLQLFPSSHRTRVKEALDEVSVVLRSYVVGNVLVALILASASCFFFWLIDLDYPFLAGGVSGVLNLVPYLGVILSWIPPFVVGLTKWKTAGPYFGIAMLLSFLHLIALNVLFPALVGRRVHLNAVAVTLSLVFWGWMWGGIGLLLAIPITATLKVICDHVDSWQPIGRWIGS